MKKSKLIILLIGIAFISSIRLSAQMADFNGTWKLDQSKSTLIEYTPILKRIEIKIKSDSLLTERYYDTGDAQEYPFTENVALNGEECKITIYEMPRKAKAKWSEQDGSIIFESTTTFTGDNGSQDFISKEAWKVDKLNGILTISFKNSLAGNEGEGAFIFNKALTN